MVGFVQSVPSMGGSQGSLTAHNVQCFHGNQDKYMDIEGTETRGNLNTFKYAKITRHSAASLIEVSKPLDDTAQAGDKPAQPATPATPATPAPEKTLA